MTLYSRFKNKIKHLLKEKKLSVFKIDFLYFNSIDKKKKLSNNWEDIYPCLNDNTQSTAFDAHYIYHPAWAARIVRKINPKKHIDISSILNFCSILSAFVPTEFYDYRPASISLSNLSSGKADLTNLFFESNSVESISCMHTVEHIGLGRYGDQIDADADLKAINELKRVVRIGGSLLFVVPVGEPKIMFNAHRIYNPHMIVDYFDGFELKKFSLVNDQNDFIDHADLNDGLAQHYGCGCFWFMKR